MIPKHDIFDAANEVITEYFDETPISLADPEELARLVADEIYKIQIEDWSEEEEKAEILDEMYRDDGGEAG